MGFGSDWSKEGAKDGQADLHNARLRVCPPGNAEKQLGSQSVKLDF
jgi:hypothetical protein